MGTRDFLQRDYFAHESHGSDLVRGGALTGFEHE